MHTRKHDFSARAIETFDMSSRAATQNAANSDIDNEASNAATGGASDTRKRKAPISRPSSAKKTTAAKRKNGKVTNSNDGDAAQDVGSSGAPLQADRDDSLDVDEDEEDEDDGTGSKAGGGPSSKAKPSKYALLLDN